MASTSTSKVVLILGSGPNIGQSLAQAFKAKGYKVAVTSRKAKSEDSTTDQLHISSDLSNPNSVIEVFSKVKAAFGIPSVVVYNAATSSSKDAKNPLSLPLDKFTQDFNVNTTSTYVAAQQAVLGFEQLPDSASRTFIYTGNVLNVAIIPALMTLGVGKSATAHVIRVAAEAYKDRGFKFYYCDERKADGKPAYFDINGEAHGEFYTKLSEDKTQGPWQQTFVAGKGYKSFPAGTD